MISYAQNLEDVLLARVFRGQQTGFYVDVGANHPIKLSITKHFYDLGWRGINIEPGHVYQELAAARERDINLNVAISNESGERMFYEYPVGHALSSFSSELPDVEEHWLAGRIERKVTTLTLRDLFEQHQPPTIDFMNVDVEGHQREVLEGNDWTRWRPRVVLAEATDPTHREVFNESGWEGILLQANYRPVHFDGLNRYYLREEDAALASRFVAPANVLDNFVPVQVMELRRDMRQQTLALNDKAEKLAQTESRLQVTHDNLVRIRSRLQREATEREELSQQLERSQLELKELQQVRQKYAEEVHAHEKERARLLETQRRIAQDLETNVSELNRIRHKVDADSLEFGLRLARLYHKIKTLPRRIWGLRAA